MPFLVMTPKFFLHYQDHNPTGSASILLLHGLGATADSWIFQVPCLVERGFRVLTPDARGFGQSGFPGGSVRISDMASDMATLLRHLNLEKVDVVGISMGGTIALQLVLDHPDIVNRLVLVNTFASLRPDRFSMWFYFALRFILVHTLGLPAQAKAVAQRIFPSPGQASLRQVLIEQICQADPRGYRAAMRALALFNVTARLAEINSPTLVISGEQDTTVPLKAQSLLAQKINMARHVLLPNTGHAVSVERPAEFNDILLEFLTTPKL